MAGETTTKLERRRARTAALEARARQLSARAAEERSRHGSVDALFELVDRDVEVGGGIIAGALAYRLFIWLLPFGLVLVAGLGIAADASSSTPTGAAGSMGLGGLVSGSISSAAKSSSRWYALLIGVPILLYATKSVLRVLIGAHRLVWTDLRAAAPRPTWAATGRLLALILFLALFSVGTGAARAWSVAAGVVASLIVVAPYAGIWLLVSLRLPHRGVPWRELIPGAVLFAVGADLIQIGAAYVLGPMALSKQGTYGALGIAAALLLGLFLLGRAIVAAAELNATLAERQARSTR
jgi:membrane protein